MSTYHGGDTGDGSSQDTSRDRVVESSGVIVGGGSGSGRGESAVGAVND
jgi:hypothetical protein